jgi:hypothetical protein
MSGLGQYFLTSALPKRTEVRSCCLRDVVDYYNEC